jgi:hypothetical protein
MEQAKKNYKYLLKGVIDTHIHTAPDNRPRKFNDIELAREAASVSAKAIVIKSHVLPTMDRAYIAEQIVPGIKIFGGVTLNNAVGGLNIHAVDNAISMGAKIIWLPTIDASYECKLFKKNRHGIDCVKNNRVVPELIEILKIIASSNTILATGHISPDESLVVVDKAKELGVNKIIVNHPEITRLSMTIEQQKKFLPYGVYFERCYAKNMMPIRQGYGSSYKDILKNIKALGYESTIIATDLGQKVNPNWSDALSDLIHFLLESGITKKQIDTMTKTNASKLLDI